MKRPTSRPVAYLSSHDDLQEPCNRVKQELSQAGYDVMGVRWQDVEDDRTLHHRLSKVFYCDVFVGLVARHYGDVPTPAEFADLPPGLPPMPSIRAGETSFTECEYHLALAADKRVFMFLLDEKSAWQPSYPEETDPSYSHEEHLQQWRDLIRREGQAGKLCVSSFDGLNLDALGNQVREQVAPPPAPEWPADTDRAAQPLPDNLPPLHYAALVGREDQLHQIARALHKAHTRIYLQGPVGVGRTSLALAAGYAYSRPRTAEQAQRYVVWIDAEAIAAKSQELTKASSPGSPPKSSPTARENSELNEVLTLIAQVANYTSVAQNSLAAVEDKERHIQHILSQEKFLLIVDNFDLRLSQKLRDWLLSPTLPAHVLLVVPDADQPSLPPARTIKLAPLSVAATVKRLALLGISAATAPGATPEALRRLASYTEGKFRVIELVARQLQERLKAGADFEQALADVMQPGEGNKIQELHQQEWAALPREARQLLRAIPLFASSNTINQEALQAACGLPEAGFKAARTRLLESQLLRQLWPEPGNSRSIYTVDADTHGFAQEKLREQPEFEMEARKRWSEFYRSFVERCMRRAEPDVTYWCSLVSTSMEALDAEWPAVVAVLDWADQHRKDRLLLDLVLLLVHYLDSRLYNQERLRYAELGARAARRLRLPYEEALLRIDALGWTYFDENCPHKALEEIGRGLGLVKPLGEANQDAWELFQLGLAWQARVKMEIALLIDQARPGAAPASEAPALAGISPAEAELLRKEALHLIEKALRANCSPWIRYRILKSAGDIAFKARCPLRQLKDDVEALDFYLQAEREAAKYGGEGANYQIGPRIGLAYLRRNRQPGDESRESDITKAARYFRRLCQNQHMPITGKLYGQYGEALIKKHEGRPHQGELDSLKKELRLHTSSNQLLKLVMSFDEPAAPAPEAAGGK